MKKKIFKVLLVLCLMLVVTVTASAKRVTELVTSGGDTGFSLKITEQGINISGKIQHEDMNYLLIITDANYATSISPDVGFSTTIKLPSEKTERTTLGLYVGPKLTADFYTVFSVEREDIVLEKADGKWYFVVNDEIYDNNSQWMSGWIEVNSQLKKSQPDAVKLVTASVTEGLTDNYEKAEAIHRWIADNVYYDKDYALDQKATTSLTPIEVLTSRVSVCEGFANLAHSMLNAAGIPAITVKGYSLGADAPVFWYQVNDSNVANHMWVEAYIDGKWITMDPTWDCKNMFYNGKKEKNLPVAYRYFDIQPYMLAATHKVLDRPNVFGKSGASSWAIDEVIAAYSNGLVTNELLTTLKNRISREEFCNLVMNFITIKTGKTIEAVLKEKNLVLNYEFFIDTTEYNTLAANALGIVNGKGDGIFDPLGDITRQEAAVMLQRTAKVLGVTEPNDTKISFADAKTFPSWSASAIDFVSASVSRQGTRVMGGVENNKFDPKGFYTKEQSVLTVYRLFSTY